MNDQRNQGLTGRLKEVRGLRTQQDMADALGISLASYANYEAGRRTPTFEVVAALAEQFQVDLNWLVTGEEKREIGFLDYDEKVFKRVAATVFKELKKLDLWDSIAPDELAHALTIINHTVMSVMGPEPDAAKVDIEDLGDVVRFVTKKRDK